MTADFKFDDRAFRAALKRFDEKSRRSRSEVLKDQARLFVKDVILITPPNKDFKANRKGGETAIKADLRKIMRQSSSSKASNDAEGIHVRFRDSQTGRVNKRNLKTKYRVANLAAYIKKELEKVGILASGWIKITFTLTECRIVISNGVKFAGNVKGLVSRIQRTLDKRAQAMNRQVEYFQKRAAKEAGFK